MKQYAKENIINKTNLENVEIGGYTADLMNIFFEQRVFGDYGRNVVCKEAESAFETCVDDEGVVGIWQGEFWGKWIISAVRVYKYTGSEELKNFVHNAALKIIGYQRENGYIGTYKNSKKFMSPDVNEAIKEMGWECDWNWNIWCRKYTLWALLEVYEITQDAKILDACVKMADNLITELKEEGRRLGETGTFCGLPSCSILKPMLILYRLTENEGYLSFCLDFVADWENADIMPGLIANTLNKTPIAKWYNNPKWAKVYEMMSCFDGLIELHRVTGDEKYLTVCKNFYELAKATEQNVLYSVGHNDEFLEGSYHINAVTEPCDVIHWMRICFELFSLTGDAKYMDSFELAFYNPFLASSYKDGKWGARGARTHGRHITVDEQAKFKHNHCCVNNMPRGYMNMAEACIMQSADAIYINLYTETKATLKDGTTVEVSGDYLANSSAKIEIDFKDNTPYDVKLRIPQWSSKNTVVADGVAYSPESGYFTVKPQNNKCVIDVQFDNEIKVIEKDAHKEYIPDEKQIYKWTYKNTPAECTEDMLIHENRCILQKGAVLLCRTKLIGNTEEEMFGNKPIDTSYKCTYQQVAPQKGINLQFNITLENGTDTIKTTVCDYASGTNMKFEDMHTFNIFF